MDPATALIEQSKSGDRAAAVELLQVHYPILRDLAHLRLGPANTVRGDMDSGDVAQEAALRALASIEQFQGGTASSFLAWGSRIIDNVIADRARAALADKRGGGAKRDADAEALLASLDAHGPTPSEQAMGAELVNRYRAALAKLPPHYTKAVLLRRHCNCSFAELAEELDLRTEAQARALLARALASLAPDLQGM